MMRSISRLVPSRSVILGLLSLGSGLVPLSGQAPRVRDSAGVHIVENGSRTRAPVAFVFGPAPTFDLGGLKDNPDDELNAHGAYEMRDVLLASGDHVVSDQTRVRFFDAAGKQRLVFGRKGQGPQEFGQIASICRTRGDTLVIGDVANSRMTILDGTGKFVREFPVGQTDVVRQGCFDDGTILVREYHRGTGTAWAPMHLVRRRLDGTVVGILGDFWPGEFNIYLTVEVSVVAWGKRFYIGDPRSSEVRSYDLDGKLVGIIRTDDPIAKVTSAEADAMRPMAAGAGSGAGRSMDQFPHPTQWPSYGGIAVDPSGRLWIQDMPRQRTLPYLWTVFDRDGKMLGKLSLPPSTKREDPRLITFTLNGVQLRREDDDGAVHLSTYALKPHQ